MNETHLDLHSIRKRLEGLKGQDYWRGLEELADTEEFKTFLHQEFPRHAAPLEGALDRRGFLKILGASLALAGLSACARPPTPNEKIVPYVRAPEEIIPGTPLLFASATTEGGFAEGLLVESHQGRPTKVEGNPDHPASLGATHAQTQATVLSLYDPDRSQFISEGGQVRSWQELATTLATTLAGLERGTGLRILTETVTSPTLAKQLSDLLVQYPDARWHQYDPTHGDAALEGAQLAFGEAVTPRYHFDRADVILSLEADFTNSGPGRLRHAKDFARKRRVRHAEDNMNRLYLVESTPSPTGSLADHRVPLSPSEIVHFASSVAHELGVDVPAGEQPEILDEHFIEELVKDLEENRGSCLVIAGDSQPPEVHALAHAMNDALENVGSTVTYLEPVEAQPVNHRSSLAELVLAMRAGDVEVLLILGGNPVYTAPADLDFESALANVPLSVHLGLYRDETGIATNWHVPQAHTLETWGDARAFDGTTTIMQPLISPFYGGKSELEILATLRGDPEASAYDILRGYWRGRVEGNFDDFWRETVYRGVVASSESGTRDLALKSFTVELPSEGLVVLFRPDPGVGDGRFANNGWLQELPNPFSKLTWDNAALIAPATAEELGVRNNDVITLSVDGNSVDAPVWVLPGQAKGVITTHLGYGRKEAGRIGTGIGFNAYALRTLDRASTAPVEVARTGTRYQLVSTQVHHALDGTGERRHIIRSGTLDEFRAHPEHPEFVHPVEHFQADLYPPFEYDSYAWGMVIDMTVCTGCNACVSACQAENNIPIVGKDQVAVGREMHWIRVDNYYRGDLDNPELFQQPLTCMQCEKAPCEPVCPVGATVHDHEGLNVMVYNRCVGTRYCSNNCPYKVRRFNFLQYAELSNTATELSLANNPDVTVRSRGVMEKCTYCTQRISAARIEANRQDRQIRDGEVVTACQAACPTEAIVFGDINDPSSRVVSTKASPLNYALLEELNTVPRTTYLAKVKNPNPALVSEEAGVH